MIDMRRYVFVCVTLLLIFSFAACMPAPFGQGDETTAQTERESELMTEQITDEQTTEKETQQETQTQQETTEEETTYGPLHFPEETGE
ncbi:MAG: hypothetical protein IKB28_07445 [Clostridia bacterium]|nr:hypothetical protein [Clostridia bacterium]